MHIEHINISAPFELLARVREFYCAVFNLHDGFRPTFKRNGFWLYYGEKSVIHLTESNEHGCTDTKGYLDHVAFQMTGLKKMLKTLNALHVEFTCDSLLEIGMTQVFFKDPAGLNIEANFLHEAL